MPRSDARSGRWPCSAWRPMCLGLPLGTASLSVAAAMPSGAPPETSAGRLGLRSARATWTTTSGQHRFQQFPTFS
eukprot:7075135-Alexandrium_andersonii.AAC.1